MHESISDFARRCDVTKQTVSNHCKKGRIIRTDKGIDPDLPTNREYMEQVKLRKEQGIITLKRESKPKKAKKKPKAKPKPKGGNGTSASNGAVDIPDTSQLDLAFITRTEAERLKIVEQILNYQIKTQKDRQELIERALVKRVFAKLYAVDTAELHPLGEKIAADLAAKFGQDDSEAKLWVKETIDRHVFNALQHIKRLMDDFLKKVGEEEI